MLKCKTMPNNAGLELFGALDAKTVPQFEKSISDFKTGIVVLNIAELSELRDEGMRPILLATQRLRNAKGDLQIAGATPEIRAFFVREGYNLILTVL